MEEGKTLEPWFSSPSSLADFGACQVYGSFRHRDRLEAGPAVTSNSSKKELGRQIHAALAELWRSKSTEAAHGVLTTLDAPALAHAALSMYTRVHGERLANAQVLAVELELKDEARYHKGILDLVLVEDGVLVPVDHKTTGMDISGLWMEQFRYNEQFATYDQLCVQNPDWREFKPPQKFVVDAIQFPRSGVMLPKHFAWEEFETKPELMEELYDAQEIKAIDARQIIVSGILPRPNTSSCIRFGEACAFIKVCQAIPEDRPAKVQQLLNSGELQERAPRQ